MTHTTRLTSTRPLIFSARSHFLSKYRRLRPGNITSIVLITIALIAVTTLAVSARAWFTKSATTRKLALTTAQGKPTPTRLETELITIRRAGFEPAEIKRPQGSFFLFVDNRSGYRGPQLRLDRVAGSRLREVLLGPNQFHWDDVVDLPPGNYVLTEAAHPNWICHITITAR